MSTKLVLAIVSADAVDAVSTALVEARYPVTQISSLGGFLRRGSTTMVVGIDDEQVEAVLKVMREAAAPYKRDEDHAVTVFVLNAIDFIQT